MIQLFNEDRNKLDVLRINGNSLIFSSLSQFYQPVKSEGFAIKYVVEGVERYKLNGKSYPIEMGRYLLTNDTCEGSVEIEDNRNVKGICINVSPQQIAEAIASQLRPDAAFSDAGLGQFLVSDHFFESVYQDTQTHLGKYLRQLTAKVYQGEVAEENISNEFFYIIAEKIIEDQIPVFRQLQAIPSLKPATKKDLYRRLQRGREFIDCYFIQPLSINVIAQEACMSEYHFFRLYKAVFGLSPNQYIIRKRLEYGSSILKHDRLSVSIAATEAGFSDIHTFSKAFKKYYGVSPSTIIKRK